MDTSSITYNYLIAKSLFDNTNNKNKIENEIVKLINLQLDLIISYHKDSIFEEKQMLKKIINVFFKDIVNEQGQLGVPLIKINGVYKELQTINELRETYISSLNFREKMSMMRNFASAENDCIMYSILVEYSGVTNSSKDVELFKTKYPMLNLDYVNEAITLIENILGFDISETNKCYNDLQGNELRKCTTNIKPYYQMVQNEYVTKKNDSTNAKTPLSPITLCWLWHPLVYGVPYQDVVKLPSDNLVKRINNSYKPISVAKKQEIQTCMRETYSQYPLFPQLSQREQNYIKNDESLKNKGYVLQRDANGEYTNPPWNPPYCYMEKEEPTSFMINLQNRHRKFSVSNLSGHVMKFIIMSKYFNNIDLNMIILASILFMVPYNHSIHEIFQAAKAMDVNIDYSIENTDLKNVNDFLIKNDMNEITLPTQSSVQPPTTDKVGRKTPVIKYTQGGMKRKTRKNTKNRNHKTRLRKKNVRKSSKKTKRKQNKNRNTKHHPNNR